MSSSDAHSLKRWTELTGLPMCWYRRNSLLWTSQPFRRRRTGMSRFFFMRRGSRERHEVSDEPPSGGLAFFGMELNAEQVVLLNDAAELLTVLRGRRHGLRRSRLHHETVKEVEVRTRLQTGEQGSRLVDSNVVPTDVWQRQLACLEPV